jgi:hypothetical protein
MWRLFISICILLALSFLTFGGVVRGTLLNDDEPYFIKGDDGSVYKAEWYGGSTLWFEGDQVILTGDYGLVKMISPDDDDKLSDTWVEDIDLTPAARMERARFAQKTRTGAYPGWCKANWVSARDRPHVPAGPFAGTNFTTRTDLAETRFEGD